MSTYTGWPEADYVKHLPPEMLEARLLLQAWYEALEDGTAENRLPDPFYPYPLSLELVEAVITHLDARYERERRNWAATESMPGGPFLAGPEFNRLAPPQRLALVQQLADCLRPLKAKLKRAGPLSSSPDDPPEPRAGWF